MGSWCNQVKTKKTKLAIYFLKTIVKVTCVEKKHVHWFVI